MSPIVQYLWLIPALPLLAAAFMSVCKQRRREFAATLSIGSMAGSLVLASVAFKDALQHSGSGGEIERQYFNFNWFQFGDQTLKLGWVLDPLTAVMLVMVCFV